MDSNQMKMMQWRQMLQRQAMLRAYAYQQRHVTGAISANGQMKRNSYKSISRVSDDWFLDYIEYDAKDISPDKANKYFKKSSQVGYGLCTGVHKGNRVLRQLDWYYNNEAEFIIKMCKCPEKGVLYDSIGVTATSPKLTTSIVKSLIESKSYSEYFDILPYETVDGVNEKGIYAQSNVVEKNDVIDIDINPTATEECCCSIMLVRFILDRVKDLGDGSSVEDNGSLGELLDSLHMYGIDPKFMSYNTHILVADKEGHTKIIEFKEDGYEITLFHTMANFRTNNGFSQTMLGSPIWESIEPNGQGVERWAIGNMFVRSSQDTSFQAFKQLREQLSFTNSYLSSWEHDPSAEYKQHLKLWFTDNLSGDLSAGGLSVMDAFNYHFEQTFPTEHPDRKDLFDKSLSANWNDFKNRSRENPNTWHTTHSCIYDLENLSCNLCSQEKKDESWNVYFNGQVQKAE